jgi:hypothetical protein
MLVSSPEVPSDANDALLAPSARMQEQRTATTVVAARRPTRPAPSASSACRATSRAIMVNANNAQQTRSPLVLDLASAIRAVLVCKPMSTRLHAKYAQPVHSPTTTATARHASPVPSRELVQVYVSTALVAPRPTAIVPNVCTAILASSPTADRNAKPAP